MGEKLERYVLSSDASEFVGRIYDLSIVGMHFETYDEVSKYSDAKYAFDVNERTTLLVRRVESLNHIGDLLWPERPLPLASLPVSPYEYCNLIQDVFLMRIISVVDCCSILLAAVLELGLHPKQAHLDKIRKMSPGNACVDALEDLWRQQEELRIERNVRIHWAEEGEFTDDDETFKMAALWMHRGSSLSGEDRHGRKIDVERYFDDAVGGLRLKFNKNAEILVDALERLYSLLNVQFEERFKAKCSKRSSFMRKLRPA
jgi:hypothetical protein